MRNLNSNLAEKAEPCMYQLSISTREPTVRLLKYTNTTSQGFMPNIQWTQKTPCVEVYEIDITQQGEEIERYAKMLEEAYLNKTTEEFSEIHKDVHKYDLAVLTMFRIFLDEEFKVMPLNQVNKYIHYGNS